MGIFYISPPLNRAVDYGTQEFQKICKVREKYIRILNVYTYNCYATTTQPTPRSMQTAPLDCHFADLRDLNVPRGWDGVHPTDEGVYE